MATAATTTIVISSTDLANADTFLTQFLTDNIPTANFGVGGVVRDFCVKAIAYVFAYLQQEKNYVLDMQSLSSLGQLPSSSDVDEAVDALLSNWFIDRNQGRQSTVPVTCHFSSSADVTFATSTKFFRTQAIGFTPNAVADFVIPASQLTTNINSDGTVADYTCTISMIAINAGSAGDIAPGQFVSSDAFNPYFTYAENLSQGQDGLDVETTSQLLARAPTAISIRALINARSIQTLLQQNFQGLSAVLTVGMGDPEMLRDLVDNTGVYLQIHTGGFADVFLNLPRSSVSETLTIGGQFARPDGLVLVLRDTTQNFVTSGVTAGMVLLVSAGLPGIPPSMPFIITSVAATELTVQSRTPFAQATDTLGTYINYTIGTLSPAFSDVLSDTGAPLTTGQTSLSTTIPHGVMLTGQPHYKITSAIIQTAPTTTALTRVNGMPTTLGTYGITNLNPQAAQSSYTMDELLIYDPTNTYTGNNIVVTYETLASYADIQAYIEDQFNRVVTANVLGRGLHPVYVSTSILYQLSATATSVPTANDIQTSIASFISNFDATVTPLDVSAISQYLRTQYPQIGYIVSPFALTYSLYAPDGQVYTFTTTDIVSIAPNYPNNNAKLTNGASLIVPIYSANIDPSQPGNLPIFTAANQILASQLQNLGVSDRLLRYLALPTDISVTQISS